MIRDRCDVCVAGKSKCAECCENPIYVNVPPRSLFQAEEQVLCTFLVSMLFYLPALGLFFVVRNFVFRTVLCYNIDTIIQHKEALCRFQEYR